MQSETPTPPQSQSTTNDDNTESEVSAWIKTPSTETWGPEPSDDPTINALAQLVYRAECGVFQSQRVADALERIADEMHTQNEQAAALSGMMMGGKR
jgi:hypothetical protein